MFCPVTQHTSSLQCIEVSLMSEWVGFYAAPAIFQPYHAKEQIKFLYTWITNQAFLPEEPVLYPLGHITTNLYVQGDGVAYG